MIIRKNAKDLSVSEINDFVSALKSLKAEMVTAPDGSTINHYDVFGAIHLGVTYKTKNGNPLGLDRNGAHGNAAFLSWHREFLLRIERELQRVSNNPSLGIPFWDWTDTDTTFNKVFTDNFMGPNGSGANVNLPGIGIVGKTMTSGPFSKSNGWVVDSRVHIYRAHSNANLGDELSRTLSDASALPEASQIDALFSYNNYEEFRDNIETGSEMHNDMHFWVRGSMLAHSSPVDPIFLMNHANIDRIWGLWQALGHAGINYYPSTGEPYGHNLTDSMWPWDGGSTGIQTRQDIWDLIPRTSDDVKCIEVLDCYKLNITYVTWERVKALLDLALKRWKDRTGVNPDLDMHNPGGVFGWNDKETLLDSKAFEQQLIEPIQIGNNLGFETNLVKVLRGQLTGAPKMPKGGPYLSDHEISEIAHWIDSGTPD